MKKVSFVLGILSLVFIIALAFIHFTHPAKDEHKLMPRTLPPLVLHTVTGETVQVEERFPGSDYLFCFFAESSPTSLTQLTELNKVISARPEELQILLIHLGRMNAPLPHWIAPELQLFIDPEGRLAETIPIRSVPTLLLLKRDRLEVQFAERLVLAEELINWFTLLNELRNQVSTP